MEKEKIKEISVAIVNGIKLWDVSTQWHVLKCMYHNVMLVISVMHGVRNLLVNNQA